MSKELEVLERHRKSIADLLDNGTILPELHYVFMKELDLIETALKRNSELEEEHEILQTIRDNFDLWIEPTCKATLQFQQCCTMTISEYEKLIKYFGEPRDD